MMLRLSLLCLCLCLYKQGTHGASVSVTEVEVGGLAELPCLSIDDFHRFMFWQLKDDTPDKTRIIGPGNPPDEKKYNYEVLSGKLLIKSVSTAESGFYKCVSRGIEDNSAINVHVVELVVKKDFQGLTESSFETHLLWGMAITMFILVGIAMTLFILILKRKRAQQNVFGIMDESRENSPAKYISSMQSAPMTPSSRNLEAGGIANMGLDVDFPKVFHQLQKGQTLPL
ncbi:hypothetical protein QAD02_012112 [Eretmocerus hayati]|uniref:Uncharacterized protein n=1 Tax=Eretmocerus hayati TaxID=131215 RepID=A0ACC2NYQ6_9HYME|nr:hypothetical protein QAD02_012112 [Eretmocerus hayati]